MQIRSAVRIPLLFRLTNVPFFFLMSISRGRKSRVCLRRPLSRCLPVVEANKMFSIYAGFFLVIQDCVDVLTETNKLAATAFGIGAVLSAEVFYLFSRVITVWCFWWKGRNVIYCSLVALLNQNIVLGWIIIKTGRRFYLKCFLRY